MPKAFFEKGAEEEMLEHGQKFLLRSAGEGDPTGRRPSSRPYGTQQSRMSNYDSFFTFGSLDFLEQPTPSHRGP